MVEYTVTTAVKLTEETLRDIVITGVEGGIGYWCQTATWRPVSNPEGILETRFREIVDERLSPDDEAAYGPWMILDPQKFAEAIVQRANVMGYPIDNETLAGTFDSIDADVAIQMALLGEVRYG